jgi:hypothetical protein
MSHIRREDLFARQPEARGLAEIAAEVRDAIADGLERYRDSTARRFVEDVAIPVFTALAILTVDTFQPELIPATAPVLAANCARLVPVIDRMAKAYGVAVLCKKARDTAEGLAKRGGKGKSGRPPWKQSEIDVGKTLGPRVREQISYLYGKEVRRGMKGSVRPDFVMDGVASFEVKNYTIATNKSGLIRDVVEQAKKRAVHLPKGMRQFVKIDVRGQNVSTAVRNTIKQKIENKTGGIISVDDIKFFGETQ